MMLESEVLGLLLNDAEDRRGASRHRGGSAQILLRDADGCMRLQDVSPDSAMGRQAMSTGCFRRRAPIYDPITREIMGYEMERVAEAHLGKLGS